LRELPLALSSDPHRDEWTSCWQVIPHGLASKLTRQSIWRYIVRSSCQRDLSEKEKEPITL
jgi:hypothetical protein